MVVFLTFQPWMKLDSNSYKNYTFSLKLQLMDDPLDTALLKLSFREGDGVLDAEIF